MAGARATAIVRALALAVAAAAGVGCRAVPSTPGDDLGVDLGVPGDDLGGGGGIDLAAADLYAASCDPGPEVCDNGCDDDRNGYMDADDPACTTQLLVTLDTTMPALSRLILEPKPHLVALDGNPVPAGGMAEYNRAFSSSAYLAFDGSTKQLRRLVLDGGYTDNTSPGFTTRDVCVFNGELIVVEPGNMSKLHRFKEDGKTELGSVPIAGLPGACASDGTHLYVARHVVPNPSEIVVFDKSADGPVDSGVVLAIPDALVGLGYDRLVDFAYVKKSGTFIGLFASGGIDGDSALNGDVMAPFALDGGAGPLIDGGVWHGVGEVMP
jgi:hypothetical protein